MSEIKPINELTSELTLYDHILFSRVMDGNIVLAQTMINTYLGRDDLTVISVKCEVTLINKEINGKWARADVLVMDRNGNMFDIEIQNEIEDFPPQRSRGYSALMDEKLAKKGEKWKDMKPSYLFIQCATDPFGRGKPMYIFERRDEDGIKLHDGSYIIYINGEYTDTSTALGKLCHDFKCKDIEDMMYNEVRDSVRMYKEEAKGEKNMLGRVVEEYGDARENKGIEIGKVEGIEIGKEEGINEGMIKGSINTARNLGIAGSQLIDTVVKSCNTTKEIVEEYLIKMG